MYCRFVCFRPSERSEIQWRNSVLSVGRRCSRAQSSVASVGQALEQVKVPEALLPPRPVSSRVAQLRGVQMETTTAKNTVSLSPVLHFGKQ